VSRERAVLSRWWCQRAGLCALLWTILAAQRACAEGGLLLVDPRPATAQWSYGGTLFVFPRYPGSAGSSALPIPAFEWMHPDGAFVSTDLGLGWNLSARPDVQYGVRLWPDLPRRRGDGARLRGLPEIPLRIERALFLNWSPVEFARLQSTLRTGLGTDERGILAEAGVSAGAPLAPGLLAGLTVGMSWGNTAFRQSWFGIAPEVAAGAGRSAFHAGAGRSAFHAGAGWQDLQTAVGLEWTFTPGWRLDMRSEHWRLLGAAAASPLTESRWQHGLVLSVWHDLGP
jgi:outer membrane scaffolding protein for murein synthesis (MipA/OmpV family)